MVQSLWKIGYYLPQLKMHILRDPGPLLPNRMQTYVIQATYIKITVAPCPSTIE